ncbi:5-methyltetrahydropteroyltriglutamate--homocysteine S-methyltransferase [Tractidigestivibacter montrealensis]|uniref:5-methyltetrahydropteroyltriglutamate--homocysteine S-methyltransferase n=1 Tax=Tractidigestivibacter montrealensis TaxID=2972466 RepID=A0ABT1ZA52_9ACTN|nr:5-methyltetrahydropteroyltriglutamate--homocysteine S-methyltransferase [Tractidigestivibacter montrealensis]MCR9037093.1 5-methyltetrahydropteroyltriglutamate--homocysteine S-methyltransferase [Tractidigestivibacter montrealensis]
MSIAYDKKTPHRFDVVGSFLRPARLKQARIDWKAGRISAEALAAVEDECIRDLVAKEKAAGLGVITDGEFRRETWHLDFMWAFDGVAHKPTETGLPFHDEAAKIDDTYLTGKIAYRGGHPFIEHFRFVQDLEDEKCVAKLTIPAPAQFFEQFAMPFNLKATRRYYKTDEELANDIVVAYRAFIADVYAAGCRNLQFDDCSWGMVVDPHAEQFFGVDAAGLERVKEELLNVNNRALEGRPADLTVNTHVCRGNFHSTWACEGGYDDVADFLLARENVDAFFLEFDDARSGGFEPLAKVPAGKKVVLGLVTTKSAALEDPAAVVVRIHEAEKYVPLENLCLSPQCGFASCEIGNKLTEDEQWAKVRLVREVAEQVWG